MISRGKRTYNNVFRGGNTSRNPCVEERNFKALVQAVALESSRYRCKNRKFLASDETTTVDYLSSIVDRIGEILQTAPIAALLPLETRSIRDPSDRWTYVKIGFLRNMVIKMV